VPTCQFEKFMTPVFMANPFVNLSCRWVHQLSGKTLVAKPSAVVARFALRSRAAVICHSWLGLRLFLANVREV
jgi:hypothetical protein